GQRLRGHPGHGLDIEFPRNLAGIIINDERQLTHLWNSYFNLGELRRSPELLQYQNCCRTGYAANDDVQITPRYAGNREYHKPGDRANCSGRNYLGYARVQY